MEEKELDKLRKEISNPKSKLNNIIDNSDDDKKKVLKDILCGTMVNVIHWIITYSRK